MPGRKCSRCPEASVFWSGSKDNLNILRSILSSYCASVSPVLEDGLDAPFISLFCGVMLPGVIRMGFIAGFGASTEVSFDEGEIDLEAVS